MIRYSKINLGALPVGGVFGHGEMAKEPADWEHTGESWRLVIFEYEGWVELKGVRYDFVPGDVFVFPPRTHFRQDRYGEELQSIYANFQVPEGPEFPMAMPIQSSLGSDFDHRRRDWLKCVRRLQLSSLPARANLFQLLWLLAEPLAKYRRHPAVDAAEEIFERKMSEPISFKQLCEDVGISHNQLIRLFRQEHGMTPASFLRNRRSEEARKLLTTTDIPIKEIAVQVGVPNLHYFNAFIREYFGMGPRQLRQTSHES